MISSVGAWVLLQVRHQLTAQFLEMMKLTSWASIKLVGGCFLVSLNCRRHGASLLVYSPDWCGWFIVALAISTSKSFSAVNGPHWIWVPPLLWPERGTVEVLARQMTWSIVCVAVFVILSVQNHSGCLCHVQLLLEMMTASTPGLVLALACTGLLLIQGFPASHTGNIWGEKKKIIVWSW